MVDKNRRLRAKWVWRFNSEVSSLWRKVICVKYKVYPNSLLRDWKVSNASVFVKSVSNLFKQGSNSDLILKKGLCVIIGNGNRAQFWYDLCSIHLPLNLAFPRIYALAVKKSDPVADFGQWQGNRWAWNISLRRPIFDWEKDQMMVFSCFINRFRLWKLFLDKVAWSTVQIASFQCPLFGIVMKKALQISLLSSGSFGRECVLWR